jgi:phosphomannomutase
VLADHDAVFGGEESGGYGVGGHLRNKDGVLIALLAAVAHRDRSLDARIEAVRDAHGSVSQGRVSVACPNERKPTVLERVEQQLPEELAGQSVAEVNTVDGFKIHFTDGTWVLIRPSGTEPKLRVYAEAEEEARVDALLTAGRDLVEPLVGD